MELNKLLHQAIVVHQEGKLDEAERLYREILIIEPNHPDANHNLGVIMYVFGKLDKAEANFKKTIEFKSEYALAYYNLGLVLQLLKKMDEAEANFRKTVKLKPDFVEAYNTLGIVLKNINKVDEAEQCFKKALQLKPDFIKAHNNLGIMLKNLDRIDEANESLRKSLIMQPDFIELKKTINKGDWEHSKNLLENICLKKIIDTERYVKEFALQWCEYCYKLLSENNLEKFTKIITKLLIIYERNYDLNKLIKFFFDSVDVNEVLKLVESNDKFLINLGYCQYKFMVKDFSKAEILASINIQDSITLIGNPETEDLAWLIVRRNLKMYKNKNLARQTLNNFITNLEFIKK